LHRELEWSEVALVEALGEMFRMREKERVGELEVMLGVGTGAKEGGAAVVEGDKEDDELRETLRVVVRGMRH
jgi:hypothetical protein